MGDGCADERVPVAIEMGRERTMRFPQAAILGRAIPQSRKLLRSPERSEANYLRRPIFWTTVL